MKNILKDPLVHFLAIGLGLFVLFELVASDDAAYDSKVINVDRDALLTFVQYRLRAFEPGMAAARLDGMSDEELERTIAEYVREEALHREAIALGVDKNDYVIKRRMIQSVEFVTDNFVNAGVKVSDEDVTAYYDTNREDYYVNPYVTFTHVFIDGERHGRDEAYALANAKLEELNENGAAFSDAPRHGDRWPFFVNYVERDPRFVSSHFGAAMAKEIFELQSSAETWRGPFVSETGLHLVLLTKKVEGRYPELAEIEPAVRADAEREAIVVQKDKAIQAIVDTYEVRRSVERQRISQAK
ncbi:MAG: peptidyl-prolyl cis-trans isomerase [Gammaproteobacteria bacterium]